MNPFIYHELLEAAALLEKIIKQMEDEAIKELREQKEVIK